MITRCLLLVALLAAITGSLASAPATFGCMPSNDGNCSTTNPAASKPTASVLTDPSLAAPLTSNPSRLAQNLTEFVNRNNTVSKQPQLSGSATVDTTVPQDSWVYIGPNQTVWFQVGDAIKRLSVAVDVHHQPGLVLSVYSPEQHDVLQAEEIGRGSQKNGYDLWWSGAVRENGVWHLKLKNENDFSVPYNLTTNTKTDGGVEYRPKVNYAFGTGVGAPTIPVTNHQPVTPVEPPAMAASVPAAPQKGADNPGAAQEPNGTMEYIAPGQTLWYKMFTRQRLYVWVDTGGQQGVELAIFSPGTTDFWSTKPVGLGSKNKNEAKDLFWTGRAPGGGSWYARVTNKTGAAIPITVDFAKVKSRIKDFCTSCHGDEFDFETCDSKDPAFCEDFLPSLLKQ